MYYVIKNDRQISGTVNISGAKNSALPLICCSILSDSKLEIGNMPNVSDVKTLTDLITDLGGAVKHEGDTICFDNTHLNKNIAEYKLVSKMRASILTLGPLLARFNTCKVSLPGGCAIGERPVDLHIKALEKMGATITIEDGYLHAKTEKGLTGSEINFEKITVTGTENILMAAALAHGETIINNAAREPEVVQLCDYLKSAGVKIHGHGTSQIVIQGTCSKLLKFPKVQVIPDRIEAGTYLCMSAITGEPLKVTSIEKEHLTSLVDKLVEMGCEIEFLDNTSLTIKRTGALKPVHVRTMEYPGFATDMQAQIMAVMTQAEGVSTVEENLFENRFMHVAELRRLGANIHLHNNMAIIEGKSELTGTNVKATDLRASACLVIAGLVAKGTTKISDIYHLERGYTDLIGKVTNIGGNIFKDESQGV